MRSVPKLIRRYISILLLTCVLLIILNFVLLAILAVNQAPNAYPWKTSEEVAAALQLIGDGEYALQINCP